MDYYVEEKKKINGTEFDDVKEMLPTKIKHEKMISFVAKVQTIACNVLKIMKEHDTILKIQDELDKPKIEEVKDLPRCPKKDCTGNYGFKYKGKPVKCSNNLMETTREIKGCGELKD